MNWKNPSIRWLSLVAIAGAIIFWTVGLVLGFIRPGVSAMHKGFSNLAEFNKPYAWVMQVGFVALGVGVTAFAIGVNRKIRGGVQSRIGVLLICLWSVGIFGAGIFPMGSHPTLHMLHNQFSLLAFFPFLIGIPFLSWLFHKKRPWAGYRSIWTVVIITILLEATFVIFILSNPELEGILQFTGFFQRLNLGIMTGWLVYNSFQMYRLTERNTA